MNLTLSLNHLCNLRCTYCYGGEKSDRPMSLETAEKAFAIAAKFPSHMMRVLFFGGEPLLDLERLDAIASMVEERTDELGRPLRFGLTTNGTLLTDRHLDLLERHKILLTVSLDGDQLAHDSARVKADGSGTWEIVMAGIRRAQERLPQVNTISVVHPDNVEHLPRSFDTVAGLGIRRMSFNLDWGAEWDDAAVERLDVALEALTDRAIEHYRSGHDFTVQPLHAKIVSRLKDGFSVDDKCDFGCAEIAVAPSGRLYPCDRLIGEDGPSERDVVIGDVDNGLDLERVRALKEPKDRPKQDCEGCAILDRCIWWCGCVNRTLTGRPDGINGLLCHVEQAGVRAADRLAATLYAERNPQFLNRYYLAAM